MTLRNIRVTYISRTYQNKDISEYMFDWFDIPTDGASVLMMNIYMYSNPIVDLKSFWMDSGP